MSILPCTRVRIACCLLVQFLQTIILTKQRFYHPKSVHSAMVQWCNGAMVQCTAFQAACRCIEFIATPKLSPTYVHGKGGKSLHRFGFVGQISGLADLLWSFKGKRIDFVNEYFRLQPEEKCDWIFTRFGRHPSYHLDFNQNPVQNTGTWNTKESIGESTCESICTTTSPTASRLYSLFRGTIRCM